MYETSFSSGDVFYSFRFFFKFYIHHVSSNQLLAHCEFSCWFSCEGSHLDIWLEGWQKSSTNWSRANTSDIWILTYSSRKISGSSPKAALVLPVHPELGDGAAAVSVVAGEAGCGGMGPVHSLQGLLQDSEGLDPPALMASWREEGSPHGNPAYQKTADVRRVTH